MLQKIIDSLTNKTILILGFGREGRSSLKFIRQHFGNIPVGIADANQDAFSSILEEQLHFIKLHSGENYTEAVHSYDLIIKSPGIAIPEKWASTGKFTSQTDLFLAAYSHQTIGITGTKGKSTTTSLILHLLDCSGKDCVLAGNIGIPCFDVIDKINPETQVVFELSANQLQYVHHSPHIAVLLNIFEEHLDFFGTFEKYKEAKHAICKFQTRNDAFVCHRDFVPDVLPVHDKLLQFPLGLLSSEEKIDSIRGAHNRLNMEAALLAVHAVGINMQEAIRHLHTFKGLPHRLENIGIFDEVTFFNDSIATVPEASIAALETLDRVDFLLLGGFDRGIDYTSLIEYLVDNNVPNILFTGKAGERIMKTLSKFSLDSRFFMYTSMDEAFTHISENANSGDVCLLSPAAASYDIYKNFEHRGETYKELAKYFKRRKL